MTLSLRVLFYSLWIVPHVLLIVVLIALVKRDLHRKFPIFAAYTAFSTCEFIALFLINWSWRGAAVYFQWYSLGHSIDTALRFGIIYEVFTHLFQDYAVLLPLQRPIFRWTSVALLMAALCLAAYTQRNSTNLRWFVVYVLDRSANTVQCGLLLFLFLFAACLKISWRKPVFGIALGLGILSSVEIASTAIRSQVGDSWPMALDLLTMGAYFCSVLIWLFYFLVPERSPALLLEKMPDGDLGVWNNELERLLHR